MYLLSVCRTYSRILYMILVSLVAASICYIIVYFFVRLSQPLQQFRSPQPGCTRLCQAIVCWAFRPVPSQTSTKSFTMCSGSERDKGYDKHLLGKAVCEIILSGDKTRNTSRWNTVYLSTSVSPPTASMWDYDVCFVNLQSRSELFTAPPNTQPHTEPAAEVNAAAVSLRTKTLYENISIRVPCI